jgi:hypothetical protein
VLDSRFDQCLQGFRAFEKPLPGSCADLGFSAKMGHRFTQMNTDIFAVSSNGWPFNQLARQPVPPERMGEGGSFLGRHSLGGVGGNVRSVFICVYLWLNFRAPAGKSGFLPHLGRKNDRLFPRKRGSGLHLEAVRGAARQICVHLWLNFRANPVKVSQSESNLFAWSRFRGRIICMSLKTNSLQSNPA